jgi:hypothetical protein
MPCAVLKRYRVRVVDWIVAGVGVEVAVLRVGEDLVGVLLGEGAKGGVVVALAELGQPGGLVEGAAGVADDVGLAQPALIDADRVAVRVVGVTGGHRAGRVDRGHHRAQVVRHQVEVVAPGVQAQRGPEPVTLHEHLGGAAGVERLQPRLAVLVGSAPHELVAARRGQLLLAGACVDVSACGAVDGG